MKFKDEEEIILNNAADLEQYLAGHENSKTNMDIYAKVKYNKSEELSSVGCIRAALNYIKNFAISWVYLWVY